MVAQILELTDDDPFLAVAQHISGLINEGQAQHTALADTPGSQFLDDCTTLLSEQRFDELLNRLIVHTDLVYAKSTDKDAECCVNVFIHILARVVEDKIPAATAALVTVLVGKPEERSEERLQALLTLYGAIPVTAGPAVQYGILIAATDYARRSQKLAQGLVAVVKGKAEEWVRVWRLPEQKERELYLAIAAIMKIANERASVKEYLRLMTAALRLVKAGDAAGLAQLKPHAVTAIADFVRNPNIYQCDFADAPAVSQLQQDATYAPLYAMLTAMLSGDINKYKSLATPAVLELMGGVSAEVAGNKARMVALLVLGCRSAHQELTFADIQSALDIPAEAVESWIVRAIGGKLLEGKIDQVRSVVVISRCTHHVFGASEWQTLRSQLSSWRSQMTAVQQTVASQRRASGPALPATAPAVRA